MLPPACHLDTEEPDARGFHLSAKNPQEKIAKLIGHGMRYELRSNESRNSYMRERDYLRSTFLEEISGVDFERLTLKVFGVFNWLEPSALPPGSAPVTGYQ